MGHVEDLFHQVYTHPDDDQVRLVLADALISIGDPRGELIQLQLQPQADFERRVMRLVQQHGLSWLGPLRGIVVPLAYERGFLASCMVVEDPSSVIDREEWSTVHTIELARDVRGLALHSMMRSLRRLVHIPPNMLLNLVAKHAAQLAGIAVESDYSPMFENVLGRYLPPSPVASLTIVGVPYEQADLLRRFAARHARMQLTLHTLPPVVRDEPDGDAPVERFDEVDE